MADRVSSPIEPTTTVATIERQEEHYKNNLMARAGDAEAFSLALEATLWVLSNQ
jgi:hypothetical protein